MRQVDGDFWSRLNGSCVGDSQVRAVVASVSKRVIKARREKYWRYKMSKAARLNPESERKRVKVIKGRGARECTHPQLCGDDEDEMALLEFGGKTTVC